MSVPSNRRLLTLLLGAFCAVAIAVAALPFIRSLGITARTEQAAWQVHDLASIRPGEVKDLGPVWVYRRTPGDINAASRHVHLLEDADSAFNRQPLNAKNAWRSANPNYFVFFPFTLRCPVDFHPAGTRVNPDLSREGPSELAFFREPCHGRTFDTSGRLYRRERSPDEFNLPVPAVEWISQTKASIRAW